MERGLRRETPIVEWDTLIHPDLEALARRDNFLNNNNDVNIIKMDSDGIVANVNLKFKENKND